METRKRHVARLLADATRKVKNDARDYRITEVWKTAWVSAGKDPWMARGCVGESIQGFHAGIRVHEPGRGTWIEWGEPVKTKEQAVTAAQGATANWLKNREAMRVQIGEEVQRTVGRSR